MTRFRLVPAGLVAALGLLAASLAGPVAAQTAPSPKAAQTSPAPSPAPSPETQKLLASLDDSRAELEQAGARFSQPNLSGDELQALRDHIDPIAERLRELLADLAPKLQAARDRLGQLGPKPADGVPEGPDVARDRAERQAAVAELDEVNRLARALLLQAEQLAAQISDRRRAAFTTALFQRSYGLVSPDLWTSLARSLPRDLRASRFLLEDGWSRVERRSTWLSLTLFGLAVGIGIALYMGRRHLSPWLVQRDPAATGISMRRKLTAGLGVLVVTAVPAALASFLVFQTALLLGLVAGRLVPVLGVLLGGLAFFAFAQGLVEALLAPSRPAWRLLNFPDATASPIRSAALTFAAIVAIGKLLDAYTRAIAASLPLSVALRSLTAAAAAIVLAALLRRLADRTDEEEACLGPYVPTGLVLSGPVRLLGWTLVVLLAASVLSGYAAFASFLLDQIVWVACLAALLYLGLEACDRFVGAPLKEGSRVTTTLQANLGLRRRSLQQVGVLASGIARVVLFVAAALLALAPWGIESTDLTNSVRAAFFGFTVGEVTISLSAILAAVLLFAAAIAATRIVQRWLSGSFLPTTDLDEGLRNSIATAVGYLGFFVAAAAALAYLGLSLDRIAIVAGALSVGIGFGLQSIVNNFVSGLILLWERPIRVGDLVVVGDGEGYVRRISVRATEIETFDRSSLIIPNSNVISGVVRNRVRGDKTGRVVIPVNVLRNQDPARAAQLLTDQAAEHPDVLRDPPPRVVFKKIGDTWLEFDLVCFVRDVTTQLRVQSDLNFAVFGALVSEGILPPLGPGAMNVGGLEPVQKALEQIAEAIETADRPSGPGARGVA